MGGRTVLILGGGVGGVVAANALRRRLDSRHRVVLVDREPTFAFAASFLWVMTGARRPEQVSRPLARLGRRGIEVVQGTVERIEPAARRAVVSGRSLVADHLVIALGASFAPQVVPGLAEAGHTYATLVGAARLRDALAGFRGGRILVVTAEPLYKCPAAPYEAALLIEAQLRRRGLGRASSIEVHSAEPAPMGVAGPQVSAAVRGLLDARGIGYYPDHRVQRVEPGHATFVDGSRCAFDLLVYMPPIRPPDALRDSGITDAAGWITANRTTLETTAEGVYAVGDAVSIPLSVGKPLPRAGVFAHAQAAVVARNLAARIAGQPATARFDGHGACFIETGDGRAGYGSGDFYAEPQPAVRLRAPSRVWHAGKVLFEKQALWGWL